MSYHSSCFKKELKGAMFHMMLNVSHYLSITFILAVVTCLDWTFLVYIFLPWGLGRYCAIVFYCDFFFKKVWGQSNFILSLGELILSCSPLNNLSLNSRKFLRLWADHSIITFFLVHNVLILSIGLSLLFISGKLITCLNIYIIFLI